MTQRRSSASRSRGAPARVAGYDPIASAGDHRYDATEAARAVEFFGSFLRHGKGSHSGQPFVLDDWQRDLVATLYGWRRRDGTRRYRTAYIEVPRKNGKSHLCAGIALYSLFADREPGAEVYSAAASRDQARIVYEIAQTMVESDERLRGLAKCQRSAIYVPRLRASYRAIAAESHTAHGLNPSAVIFDELHAQPDRELWDTLVTAMGARRQPLLVAITTAGVDGESICRQLHDHAARVRDGLVPDESFLPVIYAAAADEAWDDEGVWARANPGLGRSVSLEFLREQAARAKEMPAAENSFRRLHLNQWTQQATRWLSIERWDACSGPAVIPDGAEVWAGLDLSTTTDLTALVLLAKAPDGGWIAQTRVYAPEEGAVKRERRDRVPYLEWGRQGHMTLTPGEVVDYDRVRADILELADQYTIRELAIDRWNASQLATQLQGDGVRLAWFGMGFRSMAAPCRELEGLVAAGKLRHGGHPVLRWCASNVAVEMDSAGNTKPSKSKSSERIDCIVALLMALGRASVAPATDAPIYESRGLRWL